MSDYMNDVEETEELSELELAIKSRKRKAFLEDVVDVAGFSKKPLGKVRIRLATLDEQDKSLKQAEKYIKENNIYDSDSIENIKTCFILHKVCLRYSPERTDEDQLDVPAFPTAKYMIENLTLHEVASLLAKYREIERLSNPKTTLTTEEMREFARMCYENMNNEVPNAVLKSLDHVSVANLAVCIGIMYHELNKAYEKVIQEKIELQEKLEEKEPSNEDLN